MDNIYTLDNGFKYMTINNNSYKHCVILLSVNVGAIHEEPNVAGISHFLEHMPFKGTKKIKDSNELAYILDYMGSQCNASTGKEVTSYYIKTSNKYLHKSLDIISSMVFDALLLKKDVDMERNVILEEYRKDLDDPFVVIDDLLHENLFKNHPLHKSIIGTNKTIKYIDHNKLRNHYNQYYHPHNMALVVIGNFDKSLNKKINKLFGKNNKNTHIEPIHNFVYKNNTPNVIYKEKEGIKQAYVSISFPAFGYYHKDKHTLNLIKSYLSDGMSSKLFIDLRDKQGLIYSIYSESIFYNNGGYSNIILTLTPKNVFKSIKIVIDNLKQIKSDGIPRKEIIKTKNFIKGNTLIDHEDLLDVASFYSDQLVSDIKKQPVINFDELFKLYDKINNNHIKKVANDIFNFNKLNIIIYGKINKKELQSVKKYAYSLMDEHHQQDSD